MKKVPIVPAAYQLLSLQTKRKKMAIAIVTGSAGLIGSEASRHFAKSGLTVVGIDNDMRREFFGDEASTNWQRGQLESELGENYIHLDADIRDQDAMGELFAKYGNDIKLIVHTAAQPSHDWAARDPHKDFTVCLLYTSPSPRD